MLCPGLLAMDRLLLVTLTFPILVSIVLYQYRTELLSLAKTKLLTGDRYELLIVIPSARDHFDQRQAIRDTWAKQLYINKSLSARIKMKFVLGSSDCSFPPENRLDECCCQPWIPGKVAPGDQYAAVITRRGSDVSNKYDRIYGVQYLAFKVDHPVLLTKIGIHRQALVTGATVSLLDAITKKEIVSTRFSGSSDGESAEGFLYKSVETYLLPKGFEGIILGDNHSSSKGRLPSPQTTEHYAQLLNSSLLHFFQYEGPLENHYEDVMRWRATTTPVVSFVYTVNDVSSLSSLIDTSATRQRDWETRIRKVVSRIEAEQDQYNDLLIVDATDTYRNITRKLLQAFMWSVNAEDYQFLLKTDDDCYLDPVRILEQLSRLQQEGQTKRIWWGRFRHNWAVEAHGKWAEQQYTAPVYPQFACGVGYVLSQDLVSWLADNANDLHLYQGEDVSMGIWLSAVHPHYIDDPLWQCESRCISDMYAAPDLNTRQLHQFWDDLTRCADPCGCS